MVVRVAARGNERAPAAPRRGHVLAVQGALVAVLCLAPAGEAAHPGPSIWGEIRLEPTAMLLRIEGAADPLTTNLGLDRLLLGPMEEAERGRLAAAVAAYFQDTTPVLLDGVRVRPELLELTIQDGSPDDKSWISARIDLSYPCTELPRSMSITWNRFTGEGVDYIPVVIRVGKQGPPRMFSLFPDEPEHIWHAADVRPRKERPPPPGALGAPAPATLPLPLPSFGLLLGAGLFLLAKRPARGTCLAVGAAALALATAFAGVPVLRVEVEAPRFLRRRPALPAPEQARQIFASLHQGLYDAFGAGSEEAIYDRLAEVADGALLDDLYGDVYESLILREQGGAVCAIDEVETLGGAVDQAAYAGDLPEFAVDWRWRVHGSVAHWGHVHRRINQYAARYTVRYDGERWKVIAIVIRDHQRVDDG